ncbi:MAG TPA: SMI1/KNR4 family protein [Thermoguttaceae bacterium]|nr:SMI1/KNR4 family protein [Thermoguttaceae bacterium]
MQDLLSELEAALQSQTPPLTAAFADPANEDAIREAENELMIAFPEDLRAFLLRADGQQSKDGIYPVGNLIVPRIRFAAGEFGLSAWGHFLRLEKIVEHSQYHRELEEFEDDDDDREYIGPVTAHHKHIIITEADDPVSLALDLQPAEGGHVGQVVTINDQPDCTACLAPSLSSFLRMLIDGYRGGRYTQEEDGTLTETD